jgi:hypothetical protein
VPDELIGELAGAAAAEGAWLEAVTDEPGLPTWQSSPAARG